MFLSGNLIQWAIGQLRESCHPFVGITLPAAKKSGLPIGNTWSTSLDAITRAHLNKYHRLDYQSEFYFQPFRSTTYWVTNHYPSSGLQAINTQTFKDAFIHPRNTREWGFADSYVDVIRDRIGYSPGHRPPPLAAIAVWLGKDMEWSSYVDIDYIVVRILESFGISEEEVAKLFDTTVVPRGLGEVVLNHPPDLRSIAYDFDLPPDAPVRSEGTLTSLQLIDIGPAREMQLDFGERLTLIAGDNGLGKSFLLDAAWWALTGTWAGRPAYPFQSVHRGRPRIKYSLQQFGDRQIIHESEFSWQNYSWTPVDGQSAVAAVSIYSRFNGAFAIADEIRGRLHEGGPRPVNVFTVEDVWDGKAGDIEGLTRDWLSWQLSDDRRAFDMLARVLEHLSPDDIGPLVPSKPVRIPGKLKMIPTIRHAYGDVPVIFTSAGVQRVLLLAYLIIWTWQEHLLASEQLGTPPQRKLVIIVDELEAHLHPKWQRLVLPSLMSIGKLLSDELEVQVIAATHSPMVLASMEDEFSEEADSLIHLSLIDGTVKLEEMEFYKYGDISSWLMSPIFGLSHARSRAAGKVIEDAKALQLIESPRLEEVQEITARLKKTLAPDDLFWSRWIYFARRLGDEM